MSTLQKLVIVASLAFTSPVGFGTGVYWSRQQIRNFAEDVANTDQATGTNSFSRCLTELWEKSGELDPEWKGKRRWHLIEDHPNG